MRDSPYTPGAGHSPLVLAGRDNLIVDWRSMLTDLQIDGRKRAKDLILSGPRGIGKTVLLTKFESLAAEQGFDAIPIQAVASGRLIASLMSRADEQIRAQRGPWERAKSALERLGGVTLGAAGFSAGVTLNPSPQQPLPDPGMFAAALALLANGLKSERGNGGLLITIDELQVARGEDLALLAATLQRLNVEHPEAPVAFAGCGLPNTSEALREAGVTHPDRLFDLQPLTVDLDESSARFAIVEPARQRDVIWAPSAVDAIVHATHGYPAHLQLLADQTWLQADGPDIAEADALVGVSLGENEIKRRTLDPRWLRATDRQAELLAAIAVSQESGGVGTATTQDVSRSLGKAQSEWSTVRADLVTEGDIYAPRRGRLSFTVPTFAKYVLENYEDRRLDATVEMLTLNEMRNNNAP
ncbi:MAG TPA: ATP-binding protein [Acidimicrobiales bacterium]|nr:ATP-binding protein [Acidimicrobiales bacterium]